MCAHSATSRKNITSSLLVLLISLLILAPKSVHTNEEFYRIQKYLGRKCQLIADFLTPACSGSLSPECCTLFSLVDVCRTSCSGDFDSYNSQALSRLMNDNDFCPLIKNAGKQLCDESDSEHCSALRCLMNIICFSATTCDSDPILKPEIRELRTLHQSRTFELAELSACEATDLVDFDRRNNKVCPPVEITSGCSVTDLKYRTVDGSCNSLTNPDWGKSFSTVKRYLPPAYQDGVDAPRTLSVTGRQLLSPRYISHSVATKMSSPASLTAVVMAFGQYIDHDFTGFPVIKMNDSDTQCCKSDLDPTMLVENGGPCFPIKIEDDEDFFKRKCMEFVRSNAAMDAHNNYLVPREQLNALTSFIDASSVYGSTEEVNEKLRTADGRLKVGRNNMLPDDGKTNCKIVDPSTDYCLFAGDHRVNVFVGLGVFHTVFHRLHNQLVDGLAKVNPHWDPEKLYQESRKINAAIHQHITYYEYLPAILDNTHLDKYRLRLNDYKYDPSLNPSMANSFSTAAYRFGHSQVNDFLKVGNDKIRTESTLMRPHLVLTRFDEVTQGLAIQPADTVDQFFSESMTDRLFEKNGTKRDGLDLVSLNIQRGRDHGLPSYNAFRKFCDLPPVTNFRSSVFHPNHRLDAVYIHPDDIDLFIGGVVERALPGSILGPTFSCLIGQQFHDIKFGDRFFYETESQREGFTQAQLNEIKRMKLSNIICATTGVAKLQPEVMYLPDLGKNRIQSCRLMADIDLEHWRENP